MPKVTSLYRKNDLFKSRKALSFDFTLRFSLRSSCNGVATSSLYFSSFKALSLDKKSLCIEVFIDSCGTTPIFVPISLWANPIAISPKLPPPIQVIPASFKSTSVGMEPPLRLAIDLESIVASITCADETIPPCSRIYFASKLKYFLS